LVQKLEWKQTYGGDYNLQYKKTSMARDDRSARKQHGGRNAQ